MQINWFTVIAQIINFFILVWLLKRYLYKPILNAIDEREKGIASKLQDASAKEAKARMEQDEFRRKNEEFDTQRKEMKSKAVAEVNEERLKLLEDARNEAADLRSKLEKALKELEEQQIGEITDKIRDEVVAATRKTLSDLASVNLEELAVHHFINHLKNLKDDEKKHFIGAFKPGVDPFFARSAYSLNEQLQSEIRETVSGILNTKVQMRFEVVPELIAGIELTSNGYKLAWSVADYLDSLKKNITGVMNLNQKPLNENG